MIQDIIIYAIIALALVYSIRKALKKDATKKSCDCSNCSGCELMNEIKKNGKVI